MANPGNLRVAHHLVSHAVGVITSYSIHYTKLYETNPDDTRTFTSNAAFQDDKVYPSAAITYMTEWWAETFQLRFGWSETSVRPDLREITGASYIDPITGDLTRGNPGVIRNNFV